MKLRVFLAFASGTAVNFGCFLAFTYANGTPVPSVRTPLALVSYPTGSAWTTLLVAGVIYFAFLAIFLLSYHGEKTAR